MIMGFLLHFFTFFSFLFLIILFSLEYFPIIQIMLTMILNVSVIFNQFVLYLKFYQPYSDKSVNITNIFTEITNAAIYLIVLINAVVSEKQTDVVLDFCLVILIYLIFFLQTFIPVVVFVKMVKLKFCSKLHRGKVLPESGIAGQDNVIKIGGICRENDMTNQESVLQNKYRLKLD